MADPLSAALSWWKPDLIEVEMLSSSDAKCWLIYEHNHWRWHCSCGGAGSRLAFRSDVERLAHRHLRKVHGG